MFRTGDTRLTSAVRRVSALLPALALSLACGCVGGQPDSPAAATIAFIGNYRGFQKPCG